MGNVQVFNLEKEDSCSIDCGIQGVGFEGPAIVIVIKKTIPITQQKLDDETAEAVTNFKESLQKLYSKGEAK